MACPKLLPSSTSTTHSGRPCWLDRVDCVWQRSMCSGHRHQVLRRMESRPSTAGCQVPLLITMDTYYQRQCMIQDITKVSLSAIIHMYLITTIHYKTRQTHPVPIPCVWTVIVLLMRGMWWSHHRCAAAAILMRPARHIRLEQMCAPVAHLT